MYGIQPQERQKQETGANWNAKCFGCVFGTYAEQISVPEGVELPRRKQNKRDSYENKTSRCLTVYEREFIHTTEFHLIAHWCFVDIPNSISVGYLKSIITMQKKLNIEKQTHALFGFDSHQSDAFEIQIEHFKR